MKKPGAYQLDRTTTILEGITMAGGFTEKAAPGRTRVLRSSPTGQQGIMVDVTDLAPIQVGEIVTLIGQQGGESIWADEVADWIGTIPYEVLCGIGSRVPRLYESVPREGRD